MKCFFVALAERFRRGITLIRGRTAMAIVACAALGASCMARADTVTLPDTGANISGLVTAGIQAIGAIVAVIVGGYFAFLVIKLAMKWARKLA